jgi:osmotically-inducible protein OsmY
MAQHDRWRDEDRYRDDFGTRDYGRGEFRSDWERGGGYGRGGSWESGGQGYGGGREFEGYGQGYGRGREFGGGSYGPGFGGGHGYSPGYGGSGYESAYRGGGFGGRDYRDFRGGGQGDWDRAYGAEGYGGMRRRGDWGFGGGRPDYGRWDWTHWGEGEGNEPSRFSASRRGPDYGRWDWTRGSNFGSGDFGRGHFSDYDRDAAYGYGSRREGGYQGARSDYERNAVYGPRDERGFWDRASDEVSSWFGDEEAERRRRMDQFRGRGPKGYKRSDDRIREDISDRLTDDWRVDASDIEVSISDGEATLSGHVDSRDAKRRAEDIAESVAGVKHVQNNLRVKDRFESGSTFGSSTGQSGGGFGAGASRASTAGSAGTGTNVGESTGRRRTGT